MQPMKYVRVLVRNIVIGKLRCVLGLTLGVLRLGSGLTLRRMGSDAGVVVGIVEGSEAILAFLRVDVLDPVAVDFPTLSLLGFKFLNFNCLVRGILRRIFHFLTFNFLKFDCLVCDILIKLGFSRQIFGFLTFGFLTLICLKSDWLVSELLIESGFLKRILLDFLKYMS